MIFLIWNVRGFNHPFKQKEVVSRIKRLKISFVCLIETRVKQNKMQEIINKHFPRWHILHNYDYAQNGRIWMLWDDSLKVDLIAVSDQCITSYVEV